MTATTIPASRFTPFVSAEFVPGASERSPGGGTRKCLIISPRNAAGSTATANMVYALPSATEAATLGGSGCPAHRVRLAATLGNKQTDWYAIFAADGVGATAGTGTTTLAGPATASGELKLRIGDDIVSVSVTAADIDNVIAAAIIAACAATPSLPVIPTWAPGAPGTLTFTSKFNGTGSTSVEWYFYNVPAGITLGTPTASLAAGVAIPKWGDAVAALLASNHKFAYIVPCSATLVDLNTGTNNLRGAISASALAAVNKRMFAIVGNKDTQANAATFSSGFDTGAMTSAEPAIRFQCVWEPKGMAEEWVTAGHWCATRAGAEELDLNSNLGEFDGYLIPGKIPPPEVLGGATSAEIEAALHSGCSPLIYDYVASTTRLVLSVTCKDTTGGAADYRCLTTNKPVIGDALADDLINFIRDRYAGFRLVDDVSGEPPDGLGPKTTTPSLVKESIYQRAKNEYLSRGWIMDTDGDLESKIVCEVNPANSRRLDIYFDEATAPWWNYAAIEVREVSA